MEEASGNMTKKKICMQRPSKSDYLDNMVFMYQKVRVFFIVKMIISK